MRRALALLTSLLILVSPVQIRASADGITGQYRVAEDERREVNQLTFLEGSTWQMAPGSVLVIAREIAGTAEVELHGTAEKPVTLRGTAWDGIALTAHRIEMRHVIIEGLAGDLVFHADEVVTENVVIRSNGIALREDPRGSSLRVSHTGLHFEPTLTSETQSDPAIIIQGLVDDVYLDQVRFPARFLLPLKRHFITIQGVIRQNRIVDVMTDDGCTLGADSNGNTYLSMYARCPVEDPTLIFVPGYGTSLKLPTFFQRSDDNPLEGWRFVPGLTDSYTAFLAEAQRRKIKTAVAYYDWRQPAEAIVSKYLVPYIEYIKRRDGVRQVVLVGHSFGGIVSRTYIQSSGYKGDVAALLMLGTPNHGSAKVYGPWEGAVFTAEWEAMGKLIRTYRSIQAWQSSSEVALVRSMFPSAKSLIPTEPVLDYGSGNERVKYEQNSAVQQLNTGIPLLRQRVPYVATIAGIGQETLVSIPVGEAMAGREYWPDGKPREVGRTVSAGDGTVLATSVALRNIEQLEVGSLHNALPATVADTVLRVLYPLYSAEEVPAAQPHKFLWFTIDCPVDVTVTTPAQLTYSTAQEVYGDGSLVLVDPDVIWAVVPATKGEYQLTIKAREDTAVRWWQGEEAEQELALKRGEEVQVVYAYAPDTAADSSKQAIGTMADAGTRLTSPPDAPEKRTALRTELPGAQSAEAPSVSASPMPNPQNQAAPPQRWLVLATGAFALVLCGIVVRRLRRRRHPP